MNYARWNNVPHNLFLYSYFTHVLLTFNFPRCSYKVDLQDEKITKNNYRAGNIASEPERDTKVYGTEQL